MKKIIFAVMLLFAFTSFMNLNAQWAKYYGHNNYDYAMDIKQTIDGGYVIAGWTTSFDANGEDVWILKLDKYGEIEWDWTYGEEGNERAFSIQQTEEGGYIVAAETEDNKNLNSDYWILKLESNGTRDWQRTIGNSDRWESPRCIQQTSDLGYIVAGMSLPLGDPEDTDLDVWIVKLSDMGMPTSQYIYAEGEVHEIAHSIQEVEGGYIVAGRKRKATDPFDYDAWVLKLPATLGEPTWQFTYGGAMDDWPTCVEKTNDEGYILAGGSWSYSKIGFDFWVIKLKSNGDMDWHSAYGGDYDDLARSIQQTEDGGYIAAGYTEDEDGDHDFWVLKLKPDETRGEIEWQRSYGYDWDWEAAHSIKQTSDGGYIVAGTTQLWYRDPADVWVLKLYPDGDIDENCEFISEIVAKKSSIPLATDSTIALGLPTSDGAVTKFVDGKETWAWEDLVCAAPEYSLEIEFGDGGITDPGKNVYWYYKNEKVEVEAIPDPGFCFDYWSGDYPEGMINENLITITMIKDNMYIKANFEPKYTLQITVEPPEGGTTDPEAGITHTYCEDEEVPVTATAEDGYIFVNWTGDVTSENKSITVSMTSNKTITANFIAQYTLTIAAGTGGTTNPVPGTSTHDSGAEVSVTAQPSSGYNFSGWSGDASGTNLTVTITMDANKSITASFTAIPPTPEPEPEKKKGGCFIATAAYGSPLHPHLDILRNFRDKYLMPNGFGRKLVELYYRYSPSIANFIARHKVLKAAVRVNLLPVIAFSSLMVHFGPVATAIMLVFPILFMCFYPGRVRAL